jgi:hypothetical protein
VPIVTQLTLGSLDETERAAILDSLARVGPTKALGYLPLYTVINILQITPETLIVEAKDKGLSAMQLGPESCCIKSGALYVYDHDLLASILRAAADTLVTNKVPNDPDTFVRYIAANWFERDHPVCKVIAIAFADNLP